MATSGPPVCGAGEVHLNVRRAAITLTGAIGATLIQVLSDLGGIARMGIRLMALAVQPPYRLGNLLVAMEAIGFGSLSVVLLTGFFAGAVFSIQIVVAFSLFNAESLVGASIALSLSREIAPVLTGLMVTGRAGSAIATELGSMRVTEQIDALATMAVDPEHFLLVPRVAAAILTLPMLTLIFNLVAVLAAALVSVEVEGIGEAAFWSRIPLWVDLADILGGMIKAAVFGLILSLCGCYKGFYASGGARGVGRATTQAVVLASVLILVSDYVLTTLMIPWWRSA